MDMSFAARTVSPLPFPHKSTKEVETLFLGTEYQAVVEYAPSQKIPSQKSKPRVDARQGQIDKGMSSFCLLEP
jgi:hypothetical protein